MYSTYAGFLIRFTSGEETSWFGTQCTEYCFLGLLENVTEYFNMVCSCSLPRGRPRNKRCHYCVDLTAALTIYIWFLQHCV